MAFKPKTKKWLGYILYVVLVTLVLLYYLFPTRPVEQIVDDSVRRINPELGFKAGRIGPTLPAGLKIQAGQIYLEDSPVPPVFRVDSLALQVRLPQLLRGRVSFSVNGRAYGGALNGLFQSGDDRRSVDAALTFKDMDLADYAFVAERFQHKISGRISGELEYRNDAGEIAAGRGRAQLGLSGGRLQFAAPLFGINAVDLQDIDMRLELKDGKMMVEKAELSGAEVNATLSGTIDLRPDLQQSPLNLMGTLEPTAEFYKTYPEIREMLKAMRKRVRRGQYSFSLTGTLGKPIFTLL